MTAYPVKFPLTMKDCAAVLMGHALARSPADMSAEVLQFMESSFSGTTHMNRGRGGRTSHRATLEVLSFFVSRDKKFISKYSSVPAIIWVVLTFLDFLQIFAGKGLGGCKHVGIAGALLRGCDDFQR